MESRHNILVAYVRWRDVCLIPNMSQKSILQKKKIDFQSFLRSSPRKKRRGRGPRGKRGNIQQPPFSRAFLTRYEERNSLTW